VDNMMVLRKILHGRGSCTSGGCSEYGGILAVC
jgi:hypothetical protein